MPDMPDKIALYYPRITFPNDVWVKLAALYWDKLGRIVPPDHQHRDSDTVVKLREELDFVEDFRPSWQADIVSARFRQLLSRHGEELILRYGTLSYPHRLTYIYGGSKMGPVLRNLLLSLGLAASKEDNSSVIGLHPRLAFVYMEALAEEIAFGAGLHPITDDTHAHIAMGPYTLKRLTQALLDPDGTELHMVSSTRASNEVEGLMATFAFQSVLPQDISNVPVEKIIQLRKNHRTELTAFQDGIHDFVAGLDTIQQISDPKALKAHLEVAYEKEFRPQLDDLKRSMHSIGIETLSGILNVKLTVPSLLASGAAQHFFSLPPVVVGATTIASCTIPVFWENREKLGMRVKNSPASYLFYTQEGLKPASVVSQIAQRTRKALFGV